MSFSKSTCAHCSLCDDRLLRHVRKDGIGWFCPSCRQDMPNAQPVAIAIEKLHPEALALDLSDLNISVKRLEVSPT